MVVKQQRGLSYSVFLWEYQLLKGNITPANSVWDVFVSVLDSFPGWVAKPDWDVLDSLTFIPLPL